MAQVEIKVPDIGDFRDIPIIEILVKPGQKVSLEQSLVTLESEKSTLEIPSPMAGIIHSIAVALGDTVNEGQLLLMLETADSSSPPLNSPLSSPQPTSAPPPPSATTPADLSRTEVQKSPAQAGVRAGAITTEVLVLGAGPGGYTAAFRAADLGKKVTLVERYPVLGGVCLNVGCIPSKALLHAAKVITEAEEMQVHGISWGSPHQSTHSPSIDIKQLREWKSSVVDKLVKGLSGLAKARQVSVVQGQAQFLDAHHVEIKSTGSDTSIIHFEHCIIATGSRVTRIPGFPDNDPRLIDSTGALALTDVPKNLLVIGGGIIGLEMACVYDALGSKVTVVEFASGLIPAADRDLVKPLQQRIASRYHAIHLNTRVSRLEPTPEGLRAIFELAPHGTGAPPPPQVYERVLLAVGRRPNGDQIMATTARLQTNERGFIPVNAQQQTNIPHIYAIGYICGDPMLAHKAVYEAKIAAEHIAGHIVGFEALTIPSVAYTDPELAWMGLTENEAKQKNIPYSVASFPWVASGRALSVGRTEGITKLLYAPDTKRILGAGLVGVNAGELLAGITLGMEMGADLEDISLTIHPHPTLSETVAFASELGLGTITDMLPPKKKKVS